MKSEIGSEYPYTPLGEIRNVSPKMFEVIDEAYTFSGRTALEVILKNLTGVKKALLPSYCCESMIAPFYAANIEVDFYDVYWDDSFQERLIIPPNVDLVLWCNYFGFQRTMPDLSCFIARGGILIEDITHSFLSNVPFHTQSQYVIASVRKWFPLLCGGYCASLDDKLLHKPTVEVAREYIDTKLLAMKQKSEYLTGGNTALKDRYMQNFSWSNHWLAEHYSGLKIDSASREYLNTVDVENVRKKRIDNASLIYEYLSTQKSYHPLFAETDMDCPLFVPILCKNKKERDVIRQKLIEENIYCPVHWPKPKYNCNSNLYDLEMSLICDQRYSADDMRRMMQIICK